MTDNERPKWEYQTTIEQFRLLCGRITGIRHKWEMTGVDTSRNWVEIYNEAQTKWVVLPVHAMTFVRFDTDCHNSLFALTHEGQRAQKRMQEIDTWEKEHDKERAEYERLKKKFER